MSEGPHLIRLSRILELREAPLDLLRVVEVSGTINVMLGVSALSNRLALNVPFHADALKVVAPDTILPPVVGDCMLNVIADSGKCAAAFTIAAAVDARTAVEDVAPPGAHDAWLATIETLNGAGGVISNRTRFLTEDRAAIRLRFAQRGNDAEQTFQSALSRLMLELALPDDHRGAWTSVYASAGHGAGLAVRTECTGRGPAPNLGFMFGSNSWNRAIEFVMAITDTGRAREAAAALGVLAGELGVEPRGIELVLDAKLKPDIVVWAYLRQNG